MQFRSLLFAGLAVAVQAGVSSTSWGAAWDSIRSNNRQDAGRDGGFRATMPAQPAQRSGGYSAPVVRQPAPAPRAEWRGAQPESRQVPRVESRPEHRVETAVPPRTGRDFGRERAVEWSHESRDRHRWDADRERMNGFFWSRYHSGMMLDTLPLGYSTFEFSGVPYYYYQGVYYEPAPTGYIVVTPPVGAIVPALPPGAETIIVGPETYYYAAGAFYVQQPQGFLVVVPPPGILVPYLPPGATSVFINGLQFYQANGIYFQPAMQDGAVVYITAQP